ncbi:hypothetical protein Dimus_032611 [Dionaea muscipula]
MDRYQRVEKPKLESPINENEIRVTTQGLIRNYISYATTVLQDKHAKEIVLKAMGQAISKTVAISEIIKKRVPGLHQDIAITSVSITDLWEPIEDGLVPIETTRQVSMISITLSTKELNNNSPGYQAPVNFEQPKNQYYSQQQQQPQPRQARGSYNAITEGGEAEDADKVGAVVDMILIRTMVGILTGVAEVVDGAEAGVAIVVLVVMEGPVQVVTRGVLVATRGWVLVATRGWVQVAMKGVLVVMKVFQVDMREVGEVVEAIGVDVGGGVWEVVLKEALTRHG